MKRRLSCLIAIASITGGAGLARPDEFVPQPAKKHSNVVCAPGAPKEGKTVADRNLATALHNALGNNGFHSMIMSFGGCFGGGMMDDMADKFAASTKPISMTSGTKHDERSKSKLPKNKPQNQPPNNKNDGFLRWAQAYANVHPGLNGNNNNNPKESDAYAAAKNEKVWKDAHPATTSQHKTLNDGGNAKLGGGNGGSGATSFHAILFVGSLKAVDTYPFPKRTDFWNDVVRQRNMLIKSGYPAANIKVLFENGAAPNDAEEPANAAPVDKAATRKNLLDEIAALANVMTADEQLYLYFGDHASKDLGGDTKLIPPKPMKDDSNKFDFDPLEPEEIEALHLPINTSGPYVEMNITASGDSALITSNWEVYFNDQPINFGDHTLPGGSSEASVRLDIDPDLLDETASGNEVWLRNPVTTDADLLVEIYFSLGDFEPEVDIVGACCLPGGICLDALTPNECLDEKGTYLGDETSCSDPDADGDQSNDGCDLCPNDPEKTDPGLCGCGQPETENCIPTVSTWGLVILVLLLLTAARAYFGRRLERHARN